MSVTGFIVEDKDEGKKSFFLGDAFFGMKMLSKIWIPFILSPKEFRKSIEKIERTIPTTPFRRKTRERAYGRTKEMKNEK